MVDMATDGLLYFISPNGIGFKYSVDGSKPGQATLSLGGYSVTVEILALHCWKKGMLVQNAFPNLSDTDREFLITAMTPAQQKAFYTCLES